MKTHLPIGLRKALIAAIVAVSAVAYNAQADLINITNDSKGYAETGFLSEDYYSTGYADLTFSGTNEELASVNHFCHDYDNLSFSATDRSGDDTKITAPVDGDGVFRLYSITVDAQNGTNYDEDSSYYHHNHSSTDEFGYSTSCSEGNLTVQNYAQVEVTAYVDADGKLELREHGLLTVTNGNIKADDGISVTGHSMLNAENGDISVTQGDITATSFSQVSADNGEIKTADGTIKADGTNTTITAVNMTGTNLTADNGGHLEAVNMTSGENGAVTALNAGTVQATTITGDVTATGTGSKVSATTITGNATASTSGSVEATTITGSATADNAVLSADTIQNGAVAKNNGTVKATSVTGGATATDGGTVIAETITGGASATNGTIKTDKEIGGSVSGTDGLIVATGMQGLTVTDNVNAENSTLVTNAGGTLTIGTTGDGDITGNGNTLGMSADHSTTTASNVQVKGDITGDNNTVAATGSQLADDIPALAVKGDIIGDSNALTLSDGGDIVIGNTAASEGGTIGGKSNTLTIKGDGDISVLNDITGDSNALTVAGDGNISVSDAISGDANTLTTKGDGNITVSVLGREIDPTDDDDKGASANTLTAANGDITIDTLSDNDTLTVTATEGTVSVLEDSAATLTASSLSATNDITLGETAESTKTLELTEGTTVTSDKGDITLRQNSVTNASSLTATEGDVTLDGTTNIVQNGTSVTAGETITMTGTTNTIDNAKLTAAGTSVEEGNAISLTGTNTIKAGATVTADKGDITMSDTTTLTGTDTAVTATTGDITAMGTSATITDHAALTATEGHVTLSATTNTVESNATVDAGETITMTGTTNTIDNAKVTAAGTSVEEGNAITLTGTNTIKAGATVTADKGDITMSDTTTLTGTDTAVTATTGDITATGTSATITDHAALTATEGNVTLSSATNNVTEGASVTAADTLTLENTTNVSGNAALTAETIDVAEGATVMMGSDSKDALVGKLSGTGTIDAYADDLNLSYDDTAFAGTINMTGLMTTLDISNAGVGADAAVNLTRGNHLKVTTADGASLGKLTASNDSEVSILPGSTNGTATATDLTMNPNTTLHIDADAASADCITVTGAVTMGTRETVYVNALNQEALSAIKGDVAHTIIKLEDGAVNNGVSEDVRYDMTTTGQRHLQDKNMSLVSTKDGVQLVISDNFRGVEDTAANQTAVNATMKALSAEADHSGTTLADSAAKLDNILDAMDNTRSTASTKSALQQLSAAGSLVVPNMMMDTTRHHLSTLRQHMGTPECKSKANGSIKRGNNAWAVYTGGHDAINGDGHTGDYTRTHQGALIGVDHSMNCRTAAGITLGYENTIGRMDSTRAESDTLFADLYATVKQGRMTHRFSAGVAMYDLALSRHVGIMAGGHSYTGNSKGSMDAFSWNFGYELSREVKLSAVSTLTPFATVDVAIHQLDTLRENGQQDASVTTDYDDPTQVDVALGAAYTRTFRSFTAKPSALSVSAALHGELGEKRPSATNRFIGGGSAWSTESSERSPLYGELGASVAVPVTPRTSLIGGGSFEFGKDRLSVGGNIGVNVAF